MKNLRRLLSAALSAGALSSGLFGALVDSSLVQFDEAVRNYNLISFGNASFARYGDTEGGLAVGGNLFLDGGAIAAQPGKFTPSADPTLYVAGQLSINQNATLESGYASINALSNLSWSWNGLDKRLLRDGSVFSTVNSSAPLAGVDPRVNPGAADWDWAALQDGFVGISSVLAGSDASGKIVITDQTLRFSALKPAAGGAIVFDLDADLLLGNTYGGAMFSNIQFDVPSGSAYVVNVRNAAGRTLFGTGNFNLGSGYERLLWNIVDETPGVSDDVRFGNGGQFFGAVLAPTFNVFNDLGTAINGQVVAGTFTHSGAELHFTGFEYDYEVPEPGTYGALGAAACLGLVFLRRRRARSAPR